MDFFSAQDTARRKTRWLIVYFVLAVALTIAGIYIVIMVALRAGNQLPSLADPDSVWSWWDPVVFGSVAVVNLLVIGAGTGFRMLELAGGGEKVASMLGGRRLNPATTELEERVVLNIVEEMALASGIPVPPVYVLDREPSINAFAAGYSPGDAVIGLNRGTIETLNRDELQGVIAHEFSHILNGDMRLNLRLIGLLHGIQLLAVIGYLLMRSGQLGRKKEGAWLALIGVGIWLFGVIGLFFSRLIKAGVSRQREYLADASAVQFTRNPEGIAGALKMIGQKGSQMVAPEAEMASHMYFGSMFGGQRLNWLSTHPPLLDRIRRLDPRFTGDFSEYLSERSQLEVGRLDEPRRPPPTRSRPFGLGKQFLPGFGDRLPINPAILLAAIGSPTARDIKSSTRVVDELPAAVRQAAAEPFGARCVVFAMLVEEDSGVAPVQFDAIGGREGLPSADLTRQLRPSVRPLAPHLRLPLIEIVQSTLAGLSKQQYQVFRGTVYELARADRKINWLEFVLHHHLISHLDRRFQLKPPPNVKFRRLAEVATYIETLVRFLGRVGHRDLQAAQGAIDAALESIGLQAQRPLADGEAPMFNDVSAALDELNQAAPLVKQKTLQAVAVAIFFDRAITVEEAELFRAVAETLDCPVPPLAAGALLEDQAPAS